MGIVGVSRQPDGNFSPSKDNTSKDLRFFRMQDAFFDDA